MPSDLAEIASCLGKGDWRRLAGLLRTTAPPLQACDRALLEVLAGGDPGALAGAIPATDPPGPSRLLVRAAGRAPAAAARLAELGRAAAGPAARTLLQAALAFDPDAADALVALAWNRYDDGDLDGALVLTRRARAADPDWAESAVALGWFLLEAGDADAAYIALHRALTLDPDHAAAHWHLAVLLQRQGRPDEAEPLLREALRIDPELDGARVDLAWLLHDRECFGEALEQCRLALDAGANPQRLALLGWLAARLGVEETAVEVLRQALEQAPGDSAIRTKLVEVLVRSGRDGEAADCLRHGLAVAPGDPELLLRLARLERERGDPAAALAAAADLVRRHPQCGAGWHLLALAREESGELGQVEACCIRAQALAPEDPGPALTRARLAWRRGRSDDAARLLERLEEGGRATAEARLLLARLRLDRGRLGPARRLLHRLLAGGERTAEVWHLLAIVLGRMGRPYIARYAAGRACRLAPDWADGLRLAVWLNLEAGDLQAAGVASRALLDLEPEEPAALAQAAAVALGRGDPERAAGYAEAGLAHAPEDAECWWRLGQAHHLGQRPEQAEDCLRIALGHQPGRAELLISLGAVLVDADRLAEAEACLLMACGEGAQAPQLLDLARVRVLAGRFDAALAAAARALELRPGWRDAERLWAVCRMEQGFGDPEARLERCRSEAGGRLAALLRDAPDDGETGRALLRLAATGDPGAGGALRLIPRRQRRLVCRETLEWAVHHAGADECAALAEVARGEFPDDPFIGCAALYIAAAGGGLPQPELARRVRAWGRGLALETGLALPRAGPPRSRQRLRVAYLASHLHVSLLPGVIAAHDRTRVEPILYTDADQVAAARAMLQGAAAVRPLPDGGLADALRAERLDVVVDTAGLHPFHGQLEVLRALRSRVAPVQCGWLGTWGSGGGIYDALVVDGWTLPHAVEHRYPERIVRLPGGQWSWTPPLPRCEPGAPPCRARGHVTFGSTVRGFRLSRRTLAAWAALLARVPGARLELLGTHSRDWRLRTRIADVLRRCGVDPARVGYRHRRPYAAHLEFLRELDIYLDAFPGNGGLCSLDALWMGVPVVSCSGGGIGARQGRSLLHAVGYGEWAAASAAEYVRVAAALAADPAALERHRTALRQRLPASPLVDARRVAEALEGSWEALCADAAEVAAATDLKALGRALAQRELRTWLDHGRALRLPCAVRPEVSVVFVLYNQAGLTLQTLRSLADQRNVSFETLIVDNGSGDETATLLARIAGARVLRNPENLGFLHAANRGAAAARGRHILFLNNDLVLQPDALAAALARLHSAEDIGVVGGRIVLADGTLQEAGCIAFADGSTLGYGRGRDPGSPEFRFVRDIDFCSGAFLLIRACLWRELDGFDPVYAPAYYEDTDLCLRARAAGFRVVYEPAALVAHLEGGSAAAGEPEARMRHNRVPFLERHAQQLAQRPPVREADLTVLRWAARPRPRILIVDDAVPHEAAGAGFVRAGLLVRALDRHHVTLLPLWDAESDWRATYASLPDTVEVMLGAGGAGGLETLLDGRRGVYRVLLVSRPPNMALVAALRERRPELFRGLHIVYDSEAVFALRDIARAALRGRPLAAGERQRRIGGELEPARAAERVLAVSHRDAALFREAGFADVRIVPHGRRVRADAPGLAGRSGMLFVGALQPGTPNEDGLLWFVREVLPRVRERLPGVRLTVVGECRSNRIAALGSPSLQLAGRVDDLGPFYDAARLFAAPVRFAGGVPAKVIEAACNGLPAVASAVLARQLGWTCGAELVAARDAGEFAAGIVRLMRDDALWLRLRRGMLARAAVQFDPRAFGRAVREAVEFS